MDNPELREVYNANLPKVTKYWTELGQNQELFDKYKALRNSAEFERLSAARKKIVENALRDFRLGGAELVPERKQRFAEIHEELARLSAKFSENLLDATNAFSLYVTKEQTSGIPADVLEAAREAAQKDNKAIPNGTTRRSSPASCRCDASFRSSSATATTRRSRSCRRWPSRRARCSPSSTTSRAARGRSPKRMSKN
jgi:Zn-dependent oligopeptidase